MRKRATVGSGVGPGNGRESHEGRIRSVPYLANAQGFNSAEKLEACLRRDLAGEFEIWRLFLRWLPSFDPKERNYSGTVEMPISHMGTAPKDAT